VEDLLNLRLFFQIYLQSNAIRAIPENVFRRAKKIRMLFMQKNHISDDGLAKKSFAGLRRLETLEIRFLLVTVNRMFKRYVFSLQTADTITASLSKDLLSLTAVMTIQH